MKKQVKKLSKKILVLGLATSIIFTSCFSYKKINAHATSVVAGLGAYTLYEICLYIGGLAVTTLGIGYAYDNRDEIAEFGKSVIDSMSDLSSSAWILGSHTVDGDYVYGTEALQEVQGTEWTVIQGGGQSPKNDNDDDGDEDVDDREIELNLNGYFLTQAGVNLFENHIKPLYNSWVNKEEDNILNNQYGAIDSLYYSGDIPVVDGKYQISLNLYKINSQGQIVVETKNNTTVSSTDKVGGCLDSSDGQAGMLRFYYYNGSCRTISGLSSIWIYSNATTDQYFSYSVNVPMFTDYDTMKAYFTSDNLDACLNTSKFYRIADWLADEDAWRGILEDIATSLRSLQGLSNIAQEFANNLLEYKPTVNIAGDTLNDYITNQYSPITNIYITNPTYYPATSTVPKLDISVFPNYDIYIENGGGAEEPPSDDGTEEIPEIDLDGLLSIFNILFYLIMIIVMLIYLFLSCLAFIVMIFRIPASSSMLPEDMVLGYEHLKTIMIPGMNISIYGFAMALIYLFIIFAVIKLIRLEINDFKFPRSYK